MGRHTATDDRSVHPLVAEGLARRTGEVTSHRTPEGAGEVGWPAEPHDGRGLGWPGDLSAGEDDEPVDSATGDLGAVPAA